MTKEERELYHSDVKAKSDWNAGIRFAEKKAAEKAKAEGLEEGLQKGLTEGAEKERIRTAISLKQKSMPHKDIAEITSLSIKRSNCYENDGRRLHSHCKAY